MEVSARSPPCFALFDPIFLWLINAPVLHLLPHRWQYYYPISLLMSPAPFTMINGSRR